MIGRGLDARLELDAADPFESKAVGKVDPLGMVLDVFHPAQWRRQFFPAGDPGVEFGQVGFEILIELRLVLGKNSRQPDGDVLCRDFRIHRVEQIMRVALGMEIAFRAVEPRRRLQDRNADRAVDRAGLAQKNFRIAGDFEQRRQPGMLVVKTGQHEHVGAVQSRHEARLHRHAVGIFHAGRETFHAD